MCQNRAIDWGAALDENGERRDRIETAADLPIIEPDPRLFSVAKIPHRFDPAAECPLWLETLEGIFPRHHEDDRRIQVLQEFLGYTLLTNRDAFRYEKCMIMQSDGHSGKSTITDTITDLLGEENISAVGLQEFGDKFMLTHMVDKMANIVGDLPFIPKSDEGLFKNLVSGHTTTIRGMRGSPFRWTPTAKLWFSCNRLPQVSDNSWGWWRRIILLPFFENFTNRPDMDIHRRVRLKAEIRGILVWAINGAIRLLRQGGFTRCGECDRAVNQYRRETDLIEAFVDECLILENDPEVTVTGLQTPKEHVHFAYCDFVERAGHRAKCQSAFGRELMGKRERGIRSGRGPRSEGRPHVYTGVVLNREGVTRHLRYQRKKQF